MTLSDSQRNLLTRAAWTFVQSAAAVALLVPADEWDITVARAAAVAGVASVLSIVKTYAMSRTGQAE